MKLISLAKLHAVAASRKPGYEQAVLSVSSVVSPTHVQVSDKDYRRIARRYALPPSGPGSMLKSMLATMGITADKSCPCNKMARKMDEWGPDESLQHIDEVVDVMEKTAKKRKMMFSRLAAKALVRLAIWRSRRATR